MISIGDYGGFLAFFMPMIDLCAWKVATVGSTPPVPCPPTPCFIRGCILLAVLNNLIGFTYVVYSLHWPRTFWGELVSSVLTSNTNSLEPRKTFPIVPKRYQCSVVCGSRQNRAIKFVTAPAQNLKNVNILHVSRGLFMKLFACQPQEDILYFFFCLNTVYLWTTAQKWTLAGIYIWVKKFYQPACRPLLAVMWLGEGCCTAARCREWGPDGSCSRGNSLCSDWRCPPSLTSSLLPTTTSTHNLQSSTLNI